jgi:hypothetical protein
LHILPSQLDSEAAEVFCRHGEGSVDVAAYRKVSHKHI